MKYSALDLVKSASGRKYLERERKKQGDALLQPGHPRFDRVYGKQMRAHEVVRERHEKLARDEKVELMEKRRFHVKRSIGLVMYQSLVKQAKKEGRI